MPADPDDLIGRTPSELHGEPLVRASHLKEDLAALERLGADVAARVRARVRPETLRRIEDGTRIEWLPVSLNVELAEAVHAVAGEDGCRAWARASFLIALQAFFRPLLQAIVALFEPSPTVIYRYTPRAWLATYRACGEVEVVDAGAGRTRIVLRGAPAALHARPFATAFAGTLSACFELCTFDGEIALEAPAEAGVLAYLVTWAPRPRSGAR